MASKIHLLVIDPQFDFCDPTGALYVRGADQDVVRLAALVNRLRNKIDDIHVTLDSHHEVDVAHPIFWVNSKGQHPNPFTIISRTDVENGVWQPANPALRQRMLDYVTHLENNKRYPLCIWPPHCIIGSKGHQVMPELSLALSNWAKDRFKTVDFVTKGSNPFTEHYSAVKADVPDPADPTTMLNTQLIQTLQEADVLLIAGQALSHCVRFTVTDVANEFGDEATKKFVLLEDTCSNVPGFEQGGRDFVEFLKSKGCRIVKSTDFLA